MLGTLAELAARFGGSVQGNGAVEVLSPAPPASAGPKDLAVLTHPRYVGDLDRSEARAVLVDQRLAHRVRDRAAWVHPRPREALARLLEAMSPPSWAVLDPCSEPAVHASAVVHPTAELGEGVTVGPLAVVEQRAVLGARSRVGPRAFVGVEARMGEACELMPGSMLLAGCRLGDRVRLGPGSVVGSDGFGFEPGDADALPAPLPQRGVAVLEDDVEIGALAAVDRATIGETVVRRGTKIDNLVQVGHNCDVGPSVLIAAQSGLAGSVRVGAGTLIGGQAGVADHLEVGPAARLAARSGVTGDVPAGGTVAGYPALPHAEWLRAWGWLRRAARSRGGRR